MHQRRLRRVAACPPTAPPQAGGQVRPSAGGVPFCVHGAGYQRASRRRFRTRLGGSRLGRARGDFECNVFKRMADSSAIIACRVQQTFRSGR